MVFPTRDGYAVPADGSFEISAFRLAGGDGAGFMRAAIALADVDRPPEPGQVSGKSVTVMTIGSRNRYAYPDGDAFWVVAAEEPMLTAVFDALP